MALVTIANGKKWREGKVRPLPGNSPHDRPGDYLIVKGEFATIPSRHSLSAAKNHTEAPSMRF